MICFMALILYRVMRQRLKVAQLNLSPERHRPISNGFIAIGSKSTTERCMASPP